MAPAGVLRARLLPPRLPPGCVPRARLVEAVRSGLDGRLVAVIAGAGYGKTTLLAQVLAEEGRPWVWCSCDRRIPDARSLLSHLAGGVAERFPGFDAGLDLSGPPDDQAAALSNALMDTLSEDLVIVLDDVHALPDPALAVLAPLVESLPPQAHLALLSRMPLPFSMARLRAARTVELGAEGLALTPEESAQLVRSVGLDLDPDALDSLHRRTEGWPAGLILAAQSGERSDEVLNSAQFEYLAEEVLQRQDDQTQRFLVGSAALGRFSPDLAAAVTGIPDAGRIARDLVHRHLFTVRLDAEGEWFRYHHLFVDVLRRRAAQEAPDALAEQHRRAARWWAESGEPAEAVPHLIEAGDLAAAVDVLEPIAEGMLPTAQAETLAGWLDQIPRALWSDRPRLVLANGALLLTRARHEASFAEFENAIGELLAVGDDERAAAVLIRLQLAMVTAGTNPRRRIAAGRTWIDRIRQDASSLPTARVLQAGAYGYACRFDEAREELDAALRMPAIASSPAAALAADVVRAFYIDFWQGHPVHTLDTMVETISEIEARAPDEPLGILPLAVMLRSYMLNEVGRHEEALSLSDHIVAILNERGWGHGAIRRARMWLDSVSLAGLGRWDQLASQLPPPFAAPPEGEPLMSYSYRRRASAALLAAHTGDPETVRLEVAAGLDEMESFGRAFDHAIFLTDFALAAQVVGLSDLAREVTALALAAVDDTGSAWLRARAALVGAFALGVTPEGDALLEESIALTATHGFELLWTHRERPRAAILLTRALARSLGPQEAVADLISACGGEVLAAALAEARDGDSRLRARLAELAGDAPDLDIELLDRLLRDRDPEVRAAARQSWSRLRARPRAALRFETLGDLRVLRDGLPVPPSAFARSKSRALLAALLGMEGSAHRETLWESLWPDLPSDRAAASLRTTLHDLRRAIEPEVDPGDPAALIVVDGERVRLAFGTRDSWDVTELRRLASRVGGELEADPLARLRLAESLCSGPFLAEWPYEPWAEPMRGELAGIQSDVIASLAEALGAAGDHRAAIERWRRLVAQDPEREAWHRGLMRAYAESGDRALALRQYHAVRTLLIRELGVEPALETRNLYRTILLAGEDEGGDARSRPPGGTVTICFTDIVGSSEIASRLGDRRWAEVVDAHEGLLRELVTAHGGRTVKTQGDGLMAAFPSARGAVAFSAAAQRELDRNAVGADGDRLDIRVGLHTGDAQERDGDYLGRAVITASRICALADGGEILVSSLVRELVEPSGDVVFAASRDAELKGLPGRHRVHLVDWRGPGSPGGSARSTAE